MDMRFLALTVILALAGCAATGSTRAVPPGGAATPVASYLASGTEPGWVLEITPDRLNFTGDYGSIRIDEKHGGAKARGDGRDFAGKRLTVAISPGPCSDGMSDRRYAESVMVKADGKALAGCGGAVLPPQNLAGSLWRFTHIGGAEVADAARTELRFANGTLSGTAGCNRFNATYRIDGTQLAASGLAATKMACVGPEGEQEQRLFALMQDTVTVRFGSDGSMTLLGADGKSARLILRP